MVSHWQMNQLDVSRKHGLSQCGRTDVEGVAWVPSRLINKLVAPVRHRRRWHGRADMGRRSRATRGQ